MPVQQTKTDLSAKKKKLEEMREREKQLALELDLHMKKPPSKKTTPTTPRGTSGRTKATANKSTVKKKIDSNKTTTTPRRKKSKDKTLKEADSKPPAVDQLIGMEENQDGERNTLINFADGEPTQNNDFNDSNPFSTNLSTQPTQHTSDELDFFGTELNPFQASFDLSNGNTQDLNESRHSLQDDVIYEGKQYAANEGEAEEFYFPEGDEFPEHNGGEYADEFPEHENELFQIRESVAKRTQNYEERKNGAYDERKEEAEKSDEVVKDSYDEASNAHAHALEEDYYDDEETNGDFHEGVNDDKGLRQQEKIREEIQWDHLRDVEVRRSNQDVSYTNEEYDLRNSSRSLGRSIQSLDDYDDASEEESIDDKELSTAEKIKLELFEQNMKERELKEIHRTLSRENLYNYDSAAEETEDERRDDENEEEEKSGNQEQDTREMILAEMEVLKEREKELKKRQSIHDEPYDSCEEFERENDFAARDENEGEREQVCVMDKIREEMIELETREKELLKKRTLNPTYHRSQQQPPTPHDEEKNRAASLDSQEKQGALTKKPIFGSRDDLVAFFGTATEEESTKENKPTTKKSAREKQNSVIIPKVFKKMEAKVAATKANETNKKTDNQENKSHHQQVEKNQRPTPKHEGRQEQQKEQNYKRGAKEGHSRPIKQRQENVTTEDQRSHQVVKKKIERENLVAHLPRESTEQARQKHRAKNASVGYESNIQPLTKAWERRGEEERMKKERIEREIQQKKEEYLKLLEEKVRIEEEERRQQEDRIRAYQEKEHERQLLKQKQHGLNQLWLSGKPLVTIDDHDDVNDEDLLPFHQIEPKQHQQVREERQQNKIQQQHNTMQHQQHKQMVKQQRDTKPKQNQQQQQQQQQQRQQQQTISSAHAHDTTIQINRTIQRWEKIIAKNS